MAEQSISYGIGLSDQQLNAMLNSDIPSIRQQAEDYVATAQSQQAEKPNILSRIGNFFFPPAASAEPDFNVITGESTNTTNQFPFKSMADMAAENKLALNQIYSPPADTLTSLPNFQEDYYTGTGITQTNAASQFEEPFIMSGGQKIYISDRLGMQQAEEKGNVFNRPRGILSQAKDFVTQKIPQTIKGGLDTLTNFIPGMRFIKALDKFDTLPYEDRKFITSVMDLKNIPNSGIYVDPKSGAIKDARGKNVRSLRGNYAENIENDYNAKVESLEKSKSRWNEKYGDLDNINEYGKTWSDMNKRNLSDFNFLTTMKAKLDKQKADLREKIKKSKSINIHGGDTPTAPGGGDGRYGVGADGQKSYDFGQGFGVSATTGGPVSNRTGRGRRDY